MATSIPTTSEVLHVNLEVTTAKLARLVKASEFAIRKLPTGSPERVALAAAIKDALKP